MCVVCHVVLLCNVVDIGMLSGDVVCSVVCGTLVVVSVFSIMYSELLIMVVKCVSNNNNCLKSNIQCT